MCIDFRGEERNIYVRQKHQFIASREHPNQGLHLLPTPWGQNPHTLGGQVNAPAS